MNDSFVSCVRKKRSIALSQNDENIFQSTSLIECVAMTSSIRTSQKKNENENERKIWNGTNDETSGAAPLNDVSNP
jgi:hypothetical protein